MDPTQQYQSELKCYPIEGRELDGSTRESSEVTASITATQAGIERLQEDITRSRADVTNLGKKDSFFFFFSFSVLLQESSSFLKQGPITTTTRTTTRNISSSSSSSSGNIHQCSLHFPQLHPGTDNISTTKTTQTPLRAPSPRCSHSRCRSKAITPAALPRNQPFRPLHPLPTPRHLLGREAALSLSPESKVSNASFRAKRETCSSSSSTTKSVRCTMSIAIACAP